MLLFSRNRSTSVKKIDEDTLRAVCSLRDNFIDAFLEITVRMPDLDIIKIKAKIQRDDIDSFPKDLEILQKAVGIRIGSGVLKIIKGLIGSEEGYGQPAFMLEECCQAVILVFTKDDLAIRTDDDDETIAFYRNMVRKNTRLLNRCAAFAPGSALVEGISGNKD